MPRPTRIEYEGAFHHVMNRGRNQRTIFHDESYFNAFLKTLKEVSEQFDAVIHAYCLMSNHYHLLIETPKANLSRIMQHINGVYTQRHNRLKKNDGTILKVDINLYWLTKIVIYCSCLGISIETH
jgi:putative transposase